MKYQSVIFTVIVSALSILSPAFASDKPQTWDEKYKEEPFVVLLSERIIELRKDFTTISKIRVIAKIQKEGAKNQGEIPLHFDKSREEVKDIEAFTITPEGKRIKYRDIQELNPKKDYAIYSDERIQMITMPNVVVGSMIDWKATIESRKPLVNKNFFDIVQLSKASPVKALRYTLIVPEGINLHIKYINTDKKPGISRQGNKVVYAWEITETDKIELEEYMPPWAEVAETVLISTVDSWEALAKWTWAMFQKNLVLSKEMKTTTQEITKDKKSQAEKIQAIIDYIQRNFRYVSMNMEFHGYEPHPTDQIFSNKYGDCKDYTLLGIAMLSEIGVKAYPVLFPSASFGRSLNGEHLPMPTYFDHAILMFELDGTKHFTDLLIKGYRFNEIPPALSGVNVFLVNGNGGSFESIPRTEPSYGMSIVDENAVIHNDGNAVVSITMEFSRTISSLLGEQIRNAADDMKQKGISAMETRIAPGGKILEREWINLDEPHEKIIVKLKFENPNWVQRAGDMMIFGMPQQPRTALFSTVTRKYPIVNAFVSGEQHRVTYSLPKKYTVTKLPKDVALNEPFARYERTYRRDGNNIIGKESFVLKESRTPADQYPKVKAFMDDITKLTNDMIMIKKKK